MKACYMVIWNKFKARKLPYLLVLLLVSFMGIAHADHGLHKWKPGVLQERQKTLLMYEQACGERDPLRQKELLQKSLAKDVLRETPHMSTRGVEAVIQMFARARKRFGNFRCEFVNEKYTESYGHFVWKLRSKENSIIAIGYDTIVYDENNKIKVIVTFY